MDERTLNDLLECSVCLERLDTSSKVLPCQHTFCRKCLEVIVASRQELRCPECRVLVDTKIDELPPNVLLMRILEGMKNAAANQQNINKSPKIINSPIPPPERQQVINAVVGGGGGSVGGISIINVIDQRPISNTNANQKDKIIKCPAIDRMSQSAPLQQQQEPKNLNINDLQQPQQLHQSFPPNLRQLPQPQQQQQQQLNAPVNNERGYVPRVFALYDFHSKEPNDLNFQKGDVILLKRKVDANWFVGELNGREGTFPINYVQIIVPLPVPQCIALYDFKMGPNEEEGCLTFKRGTMIHVLRRVDHNWAEGRIGSCIGIFPIAFVEMNALAEQLLDGSIGQITNHQQQSPRNLPPIPQDSSTNDSTSSSSTVTTTSPNSTCSSNSSSNSIPSSPGSNPTSPQNNPAVKYRDYKEKRHSLNALTSGTNLSIIQSNRHSAEILSVPVSAGQEGSSNQIQNSAAAQSSTSARPRTETGTPSRDQNAVPTQSRVNVLKTGGQQNVPPSLPWGYLALYPYKPRKNDELELKKGCVYIVTERCLDGWFKGKNWQDMSGVFPGNYVTPLRSRDQQQLMHQWNFVQSSQPASPQTQNPNTNKNAVTAPTANGINILENINIRLCQMSSVPHQPPELPPRSAGCGPSSSSVWAKPLGHHMESFFGRKVVNGQQQAQQQHQQHAGAIAGAQTAKRLANKDSKEKHNTGQDKEKQKDQHASSSSSAVSLMKRLTNIKRSKSPSSNHPSNNHTVNTYSMDNPSFEDNGAPTNQSTATQPPTTQHQAPNSSNERVTNNNAALHPVHVRSGSCPSQLLQSLPTDLNGVYISNESNQSSFGSQRLKGNKERTQLQGLRQQVDGTFRLTAPGGGTSLLISTSSSTPSNNIILNKCQQSVSTSGTQQPVLIHHRKSQSLDANTISTQLTNNSQGAAKGSSCIRESRFRCIVSYPPNSELELELNVGDIVYVHRKQKNGWYKGTHSRTNKSGLFPASFVEPDI